MTSLLEPVAAGIAVAIFNKYIISSIHLAGVITTVARRRRKIAPALPAPP